MRESKLRLGLRQSHPGPILEEALQAAYLVPTDYAWIINRRREWGSERPESFYYKIPT